MSFDKPVIWQPAHLCLLPIAIWHFSVPSFATLPQLVRPGCLGTPTYIRLIIIKGAHMHTSTLPPAPLQPRWGFEGGICSACQLRPTPQEEGVGIPWIAIEWLQNRLCSDYWILPMFFLYASFLTGPNAVIYVLSSSLRLNSDPWAFESGSLRLKSDWL